VDDRRAVLRAIWVVSLENFSTSRPTKAKKSPTTTRIAAVTKTGGRLALLTQC
jgi:hypothetical protein